MWASHVIDRITLFLHHAGNVIIARDKIGGGNDAEKHESDDHLRGAAGSGEDGTLIARDAQTSRNHIARLRDCTTS